VGTGRFVVRDRCGCDKPQKMGFRDEYNEKELTAPKLIKQNGLGHSHTLKFIFLLTSCMVPLNAVSRLKTKRILFINSSNISLFHF